MKRLEELCHISSGGTPSRKKPEFFGGDILWAKISDIEKAESGVIEDTEEKITEAGLANIRNKIFPKGTLLFAMYASIGKVAFAGKEMSCNQAILGINPKKKNEIYLPYLKVWFEQNKRILTQGGRGGVFKNLSATIIRNTKVDLPSFYDQIRIAEVHSKVEHLISQRKESINLLDELLESTFLEMFGDPVKNEKKWKKDSLENFVAKDCPLTYGIVQPGNEFKDGVPVVRPVDLTDTFVHLQGLKRIDPLISKKFKRTILKGGEILMCVRGTTGVMSIASEEIAGSNVTRGITPIWFDKNIFPLFALSLLSSKPIQKIIQDLTYGVALKQINLRDLRKIQMIIPDEEKQMEFVNVASKIESLKTLFKKSLIELQNLGDSISQLAFKGEIDLSKVPIPTTFDLPLEIDSTQLPVAGTLDPPKVDKGPPEFKPIEKQLKTTRVGNAIMENFYEEDIAALLKEHFGNFDFRFSEVIEFFENEKAVAFNYLTSEELKSHRNQLEQDIKTFIFSCVEGKNPHLKLKQWFFNAFDDIELIGLNPRNGRDDLLDELKESYGSLELEDITGIYFQIEK